jgi:hypothetical protein
MSLYRGTRFCYNGRMRKHPNETGTGLHVLHALVVPGLLTLLFATCALADFSPPRNVSLNAGDSYAPAIAVGGGDGVVHIFWHDFTSSPNLLWCVEGKGTDWQPAAPCAPNVTQSWKPQAAADGRGFIHLVWRDRTAAQDDIYYSLWDGAAWSAPVNISNTPGRSDNPVLAVDGAGNPHVLWEDDTGGAVAFYEAHFDGSSWSLAADTGLLFQQAAFLDKALVVACDSTGALHAVWQDGPDIQTDIYHAVRPPGGPWGSREPVSGTPGDLSAEPALAVGPDDTLHCAWVEQDTVTGMTFEVVYSAKPPSGSWSPFMNVSRQSGSTFQPAIAVYPADGQARIAWQLNGPGEIYFVSFPGDTPVNVSVSPTDSWRTAMALDADGNAYVAWQENLAGNQEIFVSTNAPPNIVLKAVAEHAPSDVVLSWTGGRGPFSVGRSLSRDVLSDWTELAPPGGTPDSTWTDGGVLADGNAYYYMVVDVQ